VKLGNHHLGAQLRALIVLILENIQLLKAVQFVQLLQLALSLMRQNRKLLIAMMIPALTVAPIVPPIKERMVQQEVLIVYVMKDFPP